MKESYYRKTKKKKSLNLPLKTIWYFVCFSYMKTKNITLIYRWSLARKVDLEGKIITYCDLCLSMPWLVLLSGCLLSNRKDCIMTQLFLSTTNSSCLKVMLNRVECTMAHYTSSSSPRYLFLLILFTPYKLARSHIIFIYIVILFFQVANECFQAWIFKCYHFNQIKAKNIWKQQKILMIMNT